MIKIFRKIINIKKYAGYGKNNKDKDIKPIKPKEIKKYINANQDNYKLIKRIDPREMLIKTFKTYKFNRFFRDTANKF